MAEVKWTNTYEFVKKYANSVESEIETRLHNAGKIATGKLYQSIGYKISYDKDGLLLKFVMASYGKFVDKGTKPSKYADMQGPGTGKSEFIKSLIKWCKIKGLPTGAAFAIRRKIWKEGLPSTMFFTIPTTRRAKYFEKGVGEAMAKDIDNLLQDDIDGK